MIKSKILNYTSLVSISLLEHILYLVDLISTMYFFYSYLMVYRYI